MTWYHQTDLFTLPQALAAEQSQQRELTTGAHMHQKAALGRWGLCLGASKNSHQWASTKSSHFIQPISTIPSGQLHLAYLQSSKRSLTAISVPHGFPALIKEYSALEALLAGYKIFLSGLSLIHRIHKGIHWLQRIRERKVLSCGVLTVFLGRNLSWKKSGSNYSENDTVSGKVFWAW